jgi:hypothetical protein
VEQGVEVGRGGEGGVKRTSFVIAVRAAAAGAEDQAVALSGGATVGAPVLRGLGAAICRRAACVAAGQGCCQSLGGCPRGGGRASVCGAEGRAALLRLGAA